jgi:hypothetical protein
MRHYCLTNELTDMVLGTMTAATQWRLTLAKQIANAYAQNPNARVVMVAGSVGRGCADRYSDIEIDVYYDRPPTKAERIAAVERCGGVVELLDEDDDEWEEQLLLHGFHAATSTFCVATMERYLTQILDHHELAPLAQVRLHSLQHSLPIKGLDLIEHWCAKAIHYPPELTHVMLHRNLRFDGFWYAEDMLAARDDRLLLYHSFVRVEQQIIGALLGLNRLYLPTPDHMKGMDAMIADMQVKPIDLSVRLKQAFQLPPAAGIHSLKAIIVEILELVKQHVPAFDTAPYRANLTRHRQVWDNPPPELSEGSQHT